LENNSSSIASLGNSNNTIVREQMVTTINNNNNNINSNINNNIKININNNLNNNQLNFEKIEIKSKCLNNNKKYLIGYLNIICPCKDKKIIKAKKDLSDKIITHFTDIEYIIRTFNELEVIKRVVFNHNELKAISYKSKEPLISLNNNYCENNDQIKKILDILQNQQTKEGKKLIEMFRE
jgi:hypothetical protein